ncbi:prepilin-type N-terminal cleavage/methylation domain-containing protein [Sulfurimonas sp. SAG-AH-194-L11]|nr:prepilin-type N-terminal cleavage/methylation domain-containing protein [Sulfurimonas sp. SAG-AH-194-L11]MDF1877748.1 prepilin-type N-terminal cleavage/methylation domain-containing protein [Sulfurimonas sp. SAG-AH-194-L11]
MPKRSAFTLMEVMVSVVIVSVVIAALLQMQGNTTHKFFTLKEMMQTNPYSSFLLSTSDKYGFESSKIEMKQLVDEFELESDLRRRLKSMQVKIEYEVLTTIDTSELEDEEDSSQSGSTGLVFEIGKTSLISKDFSTQLIRVKIQ